VPAAGKVCHWGTRRSLGSHGTCSSAACGPGTLGCWRLRRALCPRERLGQKATEIGRVKYCCPGNVAGHTSLLFAPGCSVSPNTYLTSWLQPLCLSGTFALGAPDSLLCSAAEPAGSGTRCTAETRPSLVPSSQNDCRSIPTPTTTLCSSHAEQTSVASASYPSSGLQSGHPKVLLQGASNPDRHPLTAHSQCSGGKSDYHNLQFVSRPSLNDCS
jgi:hypothetical protein